MYSDNKKSYFSSYEDYLNRSADPVAIKGAQLLATRLYGLDDSYEQNLPENKFLKEYKFVDKNLRFINKEGKLTDSDGRLVDENGRYVNEEGDFVDKEGKRVDNEGEYLVEFKPFLDEDGTPVTLEEAKDEKPKKATKEESGKEDE